jgi:hypothetical protein
LCSALFRLLCCCFVLCRQFIYRLFYLSFCFIAFSLVPCILHTTHKCATPSLVNTNCLYAIAFTRPPPPHLHTNAHNFSPFHPSPHFSVSIPRTSHPSALPHPTPLSTLRPSSPSPPSDTMDDKAAVKALSDARDSGENLSARSTGALSRSRIHTHFFYLTLFVLFSCFLLIFFFYLQDFLKRIIPSILTLLN